MVDAEGVWGNGGVWTCMEETGGGGDSARAVKNLIHVCARVSVRIMRIYARAYNKLNTTILLRRTSGETLQAVRLDKEPWNLERNISNKNHL